MSIKEFGSTPKKRITRSFVVITTLFVLILVVLGHDLIDSKNNSARDTRLLKATVLLSQANSDRIKDIQASRTYSCQRTYQGIREVFSPFIPEHPQNQEQQLDIKRFNDNIDRLIAGCVRQTDPNKKKKPGG